MDATARSSAGVVAFRATLGLSGIAEHAVRVALASGLLQWVRGAAYRGGAADVRYHGYRGCPKGKHARRGEESCSQHTTSPEPGELYRGVRWRQILTRPAPLMGRRRAQDGVASTPC